MPVTKEQIGSALNTVRAVADTIRELGEVPAGRLYSVFMEAGIGVHEFERIISILLRSGVVTKSGHFLKWSA